MRRRVTTTKKGSTPVIRPPSASAYNTPPLISGSTAYAGAEGPGRMANVAPQYLFLITSLSPNSIASNISNTERGTNVWAGSLRGWLENMPAGTIAICLMQGAVELLYAAISTTGRKRFGGEFAVGKGITVKMRNKVSSVARIDNPGGINHGYGYWPGDTPIVLQGSAHNVLLGLRVQRGTGDWTIKEGGGNSILVRSDDTIVGWCGGSFASDQSIGVSAGAQRVTLVDNFWGQAIDTDIHTEKVDPNKWPITVRYETESHARGPFIFGGNEIMMLRGATFQLKDRQALNSVDVHHALVHQINHVNVGCLRGIGLQSKNDSKPIFQAGSVTAKMLFRANAIGNLFVPGPLSGNYEHYLKPWNPWELFADDNARLDLKQADGSFTPRNALGAGWSRLGTTREWIQVLSDGQTVTHKADQPTIFLASKLPHAPVMRLPLKDLIAYNKKFAGVSVFRDPLTGLEVNRQDALNVNNKKWMDGSVPVPNATLSADPNKPNNYYQYEPPITVESMPVDDFFNNVLNKWIAREQPGAKWNTQFVGPNGRMATCIEHLLDDGRFHPKETMPTGYVMA